MWVRNIWSRVRPLAAPLWSSSRPTPAGMSVGSSPTRWTLFYGTRSRNSRGSSKQCGANARRKPTPGSDCLMLLLAAALLLVIPMACSGCCSTPTVRPLLPPGQPAAVTAERLAHELLRYYPVGGPVPDFVKIPPSYLQRVFAHLDEWRAYAKALEAAGDWEK